MADSEDEKDIVRSEVNNKACKNNLDHKITNTYIMNIVHHYFYIFYAQTQSKDDVLSTPGILKLYEDRYPSWDRKISRDPLMIATHI